MARSVLATGDWWRDLGRRLFRQSIQVSVPILLAVQAAGGDVDLVATAVAVGGALLLTCIVATLTAVRDIHRSGGALDRGVPAAAGVLLGFVPLQVGDLLVVDWGAAATAAVVAALIAIIGAYLDPAPPMTVAAVPQGRMPA